MKYAQFERIVILVIVIAVAVMAAAMIVQKTDAVEVTGHVMMIVVIVSSLYWGKRGALASFLLCFTAYTIARLVFIGDFSYGTAAQLIAAKFAVYGVLALLCSYMRNQFRYFFVKLEHQDFIDDETQIGNETFLIKELTDRIDENDRYNIPFSVVNFTLNDSYIDEMRKSEGISVLRDISLTIMKNDTRSVDELARSGNNLMVILPSVGRDGARICGKRLENKIHRYIERHLANGDAETMLNLVIYEYPENKKEVESILDTLRDSVRD
ncbi:MAG: diguanylate cyclase [Actinomycetota bacterium]|nr:diguanylate cyclase [Actinomycetota bacterium]